MHKKTIADEILAIFGEIETISHNKRSTITIPVAEQKNISKNINSIIINFDTKEKTSKNIGLPNYPEDFTLNNCIDTIYQNQAELVLQVRKTFYESITEAANSSDSTVKIDFPEIMWQNNRNVLTIELLDKFGDIEVNKHNRRHNITSTIPVNDVENVPDQIDGILITLMND